MKVEFVFSDIAKDFQRYRQKVNDIMDGFSKGEAAAKLEAGKYKDEDTVFTESKTALVSKAKAEIAQADAELASDLKALRIPKLKKCLTEYICESAPVAYMNTLKQYKDFGIKLTRQELEALIPGAQGNFTALRALAAIGQQSGYHVSVPDVDAYRADIDKLESLTAGPIMFPGDGELHPAIECLGDVPVYNQAHKQVGTRGRPTATDLLMSRYAFTSVTDHLEETAERWKATFVPAITDFQDLDENGKTTGADKDGKIITDSMKEQRREAVKASTEQVGVTVTSEEQARQWGAEAAKTAKEAADIVSRYIIE